MGRKGMDVDRMDGRGELGNWVLFLSYVLDSNRSRVDGTVRGDLVTGGVFFDTCWIRIESIMIV